MEPRSQGGALTPQPINSFFPRSLSLGSWPPKTPNVFMLKKSPFQPNPPKGLNLLDSLTNPQK